jgi:DnaJ-domain-containing protein 1
VAIRHRGHNETVAPSSTTLHRGGRDLYAVLGVGPGATTDEITAAFRARAKDLHPDRAPHDPVADERFKELTDAYATLARSDRRAQYDARRGAHDVIAPDAPPRRSHQVLPTRGRARGAVIGGILCVLFGLAITPVLLSIETSSATLGRDVTLWIVVAKLLVCGAVLVAAGWWRLATFDRAESVRPTPRSTGERVSTRK